ncbi:MAG: crossover junction endodeoxyribonuclease RuvC [Acidobacteriota bacterium]
MKILGIDPGTRATGFGIIEFQNNAIRHIESGTIFSATNDGSSSLTKIFAGIETIIQKHRPSAIAVEEVFFATNVKSALKLGQVRGVILLAVLRSRTTFYEYSPLEVKKAVTGYGRADKRQVQLMTMRLLHLTSYPHTADASDALAVAICHAHNMRRWESAHGKEELHGQVRQEKNKRKI